MSNQKHVFTQQEGDAYFLRNAEKHIENKAHPERDLILRMIEVQNITPRSVLEIGASNGWRLSALRAKYGCECCGIDPSAKAVEEGAKQYPDVQLQVGTADALDFEPNQFDLVIFGFCLYVCDPSDLFKIASEADRVLNEKGWVAIWDFIPSQPYRNPYSHNESLFSYKMDHAKLFTGHPAYKLHGRKIERLGEGDGPDNHCGVTLLQKDLQNAFPPNPHAQI